MRTAQVGTVIGYDVDTGKKLFTHPNRVIRNYDGTSNFPHAKQLYEDNGKSYRVIGVREGSTETLWEIDVREESSK